jgi:hypothetical protein
VILATRTTLSRRRCLLVILLACLLMGAIGGLHADGHDHSVSACCLSGLACAIAVAIVLLPRVGGPRHTTRRITRSFAPHDYPSRSRVVLPSTLGLAGLCRLRV